MKKVSEKWGKMTSTAEGTVPVVYHFRPTSFVKVAPERLREWEAYFAKHVGLEPDPKSSMVQGRSASLSGSYENWDDADYV
ncbi:MAG: hypothetical protein ACRDJC_22220 [Thermomicrobiales bacterium]